MSATSQPTACVDRAYSVVKLFNENLRRLPDKDELRFYCSMLDMGNITLDAIAQALKTCRESQQCLVSPATSASTTAPPAVPGLLPHTPMAAYFDNCRLAPYTTTDIQTLRASEQALSTGFFQNLCEAANTQVGSILPNFKYEVMAWEPSFLPSCNKT